jgi:hypothetical protein
VLGLMMLMLAVGVGATAFFLRPPEAIRSPTPAISGAPLEDAPRAEAVLPKAAPAEPAQEAKEAPAKAKPRAPVREAKHAAKEKEEPKESGDPAPRADLTREQVIAFAKRAQTLKGKLAADPASTEALSRLIRNLSEEAGRKEIDQTRARALEAELIRWEQR